MGQAQDITRALERYAERAVIAVTLACHAGLVAPPTRGGTPIDAGWASATWVPAVGRPTSFNADREDPDAGDVSDARAASLSGIADLLQYRLGRGTVFISNGTPYIEPLNEGHSPQAEAGFVDRAVARAVRTELGPA